MKLPLVIDVVKSFQSSIGATNGGLDGHSDAKLSGPKCRDAGRRLKEILRGSM